MGNENISDLILEIKAAEKKCEEFDDPEKLVFKTILKSLSFIIKDGNFKKPSSEKTGNDQRGNNIYAEILEKAKINQKQLKSIFSFEEDDFKVIALIKGKNEIEKQIKASLIILTANYYCYGKDRISSRGLASKLRWLGIKSMKNLNKNLKREECHPFIRIIGKSNSTSYQILNQGLIKGLEIINEIAKEEGD